MTVKIFKYSEYLSYIAIILLFATDILIKKFFIKNPNFSKDFLFFDFVLTKNKGIAFGIPFCHFLLNIITILFIAVIIFFILFKEKKFEFKILLFLILLAAISNFIDRLFYGAVIDYISIPYFAVLNIADIMLTIGFVAIIIFFYFPNLCKKNKK